MNTRQTKTPEMMNIYSYIGLAVAVVFMLLFIPPQSNMALNALIGATCGIAGATIGGAFGVFIKKMRSV